MKFFGIIGEGTCTFSREHEKNIFLIEIIIEVGL